MAGVNQINGKVSANVATEVTVFDVMDGVRYRLYPSIIGQLLHIDERIVDATMRYIEDHRAELEPAYQRLRASRSVDFPRMQAELDANSERYHKEWEKWQRADQPSHGFPPWPDFDKPFIFDRGRGPEIVGSRTTVYHIMDYWKHQWPAASIAYFLRLTVPQVEAAIAYIEAHREEVDEQYRLILERCERGNPPELQAKLNAIAGSAAAARERLRQGKPIREEPRAEPIGRQ